MTTTNPLPYHPVPIHINQPIEIVADPKKEKTPPPGAFLYTDIYNTYRTFEHLYLFLNSPHGYVAGTVLGAVVSSYKYYKFGPPKKIAQDSEIIDFGAKIHTSGFWEMSKLFIKRFAFGIWPAANFDKIPEWTNTQDVQEITKLTSALKHVFIAHKAAQLSEEIIQRMANWYEVPAK